LKPGTRLPTTRGLAAQHHISRGTVVNVFEKLLSEGYLESHVGSGTSVSRELPDDFFDASGAPAGSIPSAQPAVRGALSKRGKNLAVPLFPDGTKPRAIRAFRANQPSVDHFPTDVWSRIGTRRMRLASREVLLAGDVLGHRPLREAIAAHLGSTRGVLCTADQVMIVSGIQQALDIVTRLVLDPGDEAWMEDPGYEGAVAILRAAGAKLIGVPVDENGLRVTEGLKLAPKARFAFVTPAHQFPLGVTLSRERRLKLLEWSRSTGAWIFEDDYDSEFRFAGRPLAALQGLAPDGNVIFCGSFSKMLFPALRMGFLVVPPHLIDPLCAARTVVDRYGPLVAQAVLCDFITEGHFGRHLRRMREVYAEHLDVLMTAAREEWGERLRLQPTDTGLQTVAWFAQGLKDVEFARAASGRDVEVGALSEFALNRKGRNGLQIGFASVGPAELRRGVRAIAKLL
jgi:GntR family transcriptional regulator/MocR family aminotransferase